MKRIFNSQSSSSSSSSSRSSSYKKRKLKTKKKNINYDIDIYSISKQSKKNSESDSSSSSNNNNINNFNDSLFISDSESEDNLKYSNKIKHNSSNSSGGSNSDSNIDSEVLDDINNEFDNFNEGVTKWYEDEDDSNEKSNSSKIKIFSTHPYLKDNPEFIEQINEHIHIDRMIEDNYTEKVLDENKRQEFLRNSVIDYGEMIENNNKVPYELENIIKNLNFFNSKGYDINKLVENDKSGVLFRNLPLPYEQIKYAIIGQTMTGGMCIICAMNGYTSKAIELLERKLNEHIYSNNFCPILASIMISSQASKIIEKTNEYIKNNNNDDINNKNNPYVNDIAYDKLKECTPGSIMTHIMFHIQDFTAYCKILMLDLKLSIEQQKRNGLGKTFGDPERGIEYNVKLDPNVQEQIRKDVDTLLKLYKTTINTLNFSQQNKFKQDMLVHDYADAQKRKNKKVKSVTNFNGTLFNF